MKLFVTGSQGQLGSAFRNMAAADEVHTWTFTDLPELDLCDHQAVSAALRKAAPDVLINCAAYTAVDRAESEPEAARKVNRDLPEFLAGYCTKHEIFLVQVSTDYVFPGNASHPYTEEDRTGPVSAYGHSKLEGEQQLLLSPVHAAIVRTSWLYSETGHNFVKTMLRLGRERGAVKVVADQVGCPTYARDLANAIRALVDKRDAFKGVEVFHYANTGLASWYDFALAIFELSGTPCQTDPITTAEYPTPARRPQYSVLDTSKLRKFLGINIPHWRDALRDCLEALKNAEKQ